MMGVGAPEDLLEAVERGVTCRCVRPTRTGAPDRRYTRRANQHQKTRAADRHAPARRGLPVLRLPPSYARYLRHPTRPRDAREHRLTHHNLCFFLTYGRVRQAIRSGDSGDFDECSRGTGPRRVHDAAPGRRTPKENSKVRVRTARRLSAQGLRVVCVLEPKKRRTFCLLLQAAPPSGGGRFSSIVSQSDDWSLLFL